MPAKAERIDPGPLQEPNPPIPVPLRRVDPPQDNYAVDHQIHGDDAPPKMGAVSEPLPWASMNAKDAVKRPPPFWDQNTALKTPTPVPAPSAGDSKSAKLSTVKPNLAAVPARNAGFNRLTTRDIVFKQLLAERKQELRSAWSEFTHGMAELCANARHAYAGWEFRKNLRQTRKRAQARLAITVAQESATTTAANNTPSKIQARLAVARNAAVRIQNKATASFTDSARSVRGLMHRQVRIRITAGSQLRSYVDELLRAQAKSRSIVQQNSRLATSLAMAALSALLTLGLILIVGRYQPSASAEAPAAISTPPRGTTTVPANAVTAKPSPASGVHRAAATKRSPVVNTALRTPAVASARTTKSAHRPRHNEDEDYIAPDTYVYYGTKR